MTDNQPSEAALRKACEVLGLSSFDQNDVAAALLARHFDAEDRLAREALEMGTFRMDNLAAFASRHILPDPKPTLRSILLDESLNVEAKERAIRDAGLLRET